MGSRRCPCPSSPFFELDEYDADYFTEYYSHRALQEAEDVNTASDAPTPTPTGETWKMIYVGIVLLVMFGVLLTHRVGVSFFAMCTVSCSYLLGLTDPLCLAHHP